MDRRAAQRSYDHERCADLRRDDHDAVISWPSPDRRSGGRSTEHERRRWDRRADSWDHEGAPGLQEVVQTVLEAAEIRSSAVIVDLGCGTGSLSLPLARRGARVIAVDLSGAMIDRLRTKAEHAGLSNITSVVAAIEGFELPAATVDVVVSNYALHHLRDQDKEAVVTAAARWLRPGGRLVVGDMMFGRGATSRDRAVIRSKVALMVSRGPMGWWRLAKNVTRFTFRIRERPVAMATWRSYFERAGLTGVWGTPVVSEAAVVCGTKSWFDASRAIPG